MDLYMAGSTFKGLNRWLQDKGYNKLMSYLNDKKGIEEWCEYAEQTQQFKGKLFIDSGAFTAWTKGAEINVDEYINWLNSHSKYLYLFGQLDSIPGNIRTGATQEQVKEAAKKTWENYLYMYSKVDKPERLLYTFHVGEPFEYLKNAMEWTNDKGQHIEYIALGGMVGKSVGVRKHFLDTCFDIIHKSSNPNVKVHAFGMTSLDLLSKYPITSADSTSWIMTSVTGSLMSQYGNICVSKETITRPDNIANPNYKAVRRQVVEDYIKRSGFTLEELQEDTKQRQKFNIVYLQNWADNYVLKTPKTKTFKLF